MWAWRSWATTCTRWGNCCCASRPRAPRPPAASAKSVPPPLEAGAHARGGRAATPPGGRGVPSVDGAAPAGVGGRKPLERCRRQLGCAAIPELRAGTFGDLKDLLIISRRTLTTLYYTRGPSRTARRAAAPTPTGPAGPLAG